MAGTNAWASYLAFGVPAIKSQKRELDEESVKERFGRGSVIENFCINHMPTEG